MKKLFGLLIALTISANLLVSASSIEVLPTLYSKTNAQDRVWVGTFQLVWNDFMDKIVHNPIRFREGTPILVNELNQQSFTMEDISDKSYYKYAGKVGKKTKKQISKAIKKKFKETSDLLDKLELTPRGDMYLVYAMLCKNFEFVNEFDKLEHSLFGQNSVANYFGIDKNSDNSLGNGVRVLFYNNSDDYAVALLTKDNEEVYLYKNSSNKPFNFLWKDLEKKMLTFNGNQRFMSIDELKVPNIDFFEEKNFEELTKRRIMGTNLVINQAMETIKFSMDNKGVKLKSEGALTAVTTSLLPPEELVPRMFYFDDTFVIFLKESDKSKPYFALRVNDITKFQK